VTAVSGLDVDLRVDLAYEAGRAPTRHHPEVEAVLYRIAQEARTNIVKHAHAAHAWVDVNEHTAGGAAGRARRRRGLRSGGPPPTASGCWACANASRWSTAR
jgi:hypothetical protein